MTAEKLTFLSPVYNERDSIRELVDRCRAQAAAMNVPFKMVLVDDGSDDGSRELLREVAQHEPGVTVLFLRAHFGKSAALSAGFTEIQNGWIVTIDSDLQDQPEEVPKLMEAARKGADLVSGHKEIRQDTAGRRYASAIFNRVASAVAGKALQDCNSGLKVYRAEVAHDLAMDGIRHRFVMIMAAWKGYKIVEVPVKHAARKHGTSKYGPFRTLSACFDLCSLVLVERFRSRPLHFFGSLGITVFLAGMAALFYVVLMRILDNTWITNRPVFYVSILLMILGVNFFTTGMLAEFFNVHNSRQHRDYVRERISPSGN